MAEKMKHMTGALVAAVAAAMLSAPVAAAADTATCVTTGGATDCQGPDNVQIYASPHAVPASGGQANPKWRPLGYNPKWNGFQP